MSQEIALLQEDLESYDTQIRGMLYLLEHHAEILEALRARARKLREEISETKALLAAHSPALPRTAEEVQQVLGFCSLARSVTSRWKEVTGNECKRGLRETEKRTRRESKVLQNLLEGLKSL